MNDTPNPNIPYATTRMTRASLLQAERNCLPMVEKMAQLAAPDKRPRVLRLLAYMDQTIARHRDEIDACARSNDG